MKHHHVPKFLLQRWASKKDGKIETFNLHLNAIPSSRLAPKYTGYQEDLYALSRPQVAGFEQQHLELEHLRRVDNQAFHVLRKIESSGLKKLTDQDISIWLYFVLMFRLRNPDAVYILATEGSRRLMEELHRQPEQYTEIVRADDPATLADFVEINVPGLIDNFGKLAIRNFLHHTTIKEKVFRLRKWCLVDFSGQINHLLLADRPCLLGGNLDDPDLWIALPIGPR